jgi:hypothetical protein
MTRKSPFNWSLLLPFLPVLLGVLLLDTPPQKALRNSLFDQYQRWLPRAYEDVPVRNMAGQTGDRIVMDEK